MSNKTIISIDAMGGTNSPDAIIEAIDGFFKSHDDVIFTIYGKKSIVLPKIIDYNFPENKYKLIDSEVAISDEDKPATAWRNGKNSSMRKAIEAVKNGDAHAAVSCGNTGALMLTSKMVLGSLEHIKRPAITAIFPSINNKGTVLLDMGANLECNESHLFHFALMGICFAKVILKIENPKIGILNVGSEITKGRELELKTYKILEKSGLNFHGFIEGHDVVKGNIDVLVTDGFSGNIFLKASEGAASTCIDLIQSSIMNGGLVTKFAGLLLKSKIKASLKVIDPNKNNGAMLVGLKGIVIKSHGSASADGIYNAINTAYTLVKNNINAKISQELEIFEEKGTGLNFVDKIKQTSAKILGIKNT
jgi:glycerol-3-phosphate acyltransferase PlsX